MAINIISIAQEIRNCIACILIHLLIKMAMTSNLLCFMFDEFEGILEKCLGM